MNNELKKYIREKWNKKKLIYSTCGIIRLGLLIVIISGLFSFEGCDNKSNPYESYKEISQNDIPYLKDPWNDFVGFKEGDVIGIVLDVGRSGSTEIQFTYYAENCWGNPYREGSLEFGVKSNSLYSYTDPIVTDSQYFGKKCLIVGKVQKIIIISPKHACDETSGTIWLESPYIEIYDPQKQVTRSSTKEETPKYFIGPPIKSVGTLFGKYNYVSLSLTGRETIEEHSYMLLNNISSFEKDIKGISDKEITISRNGNWDGYSVYVDNFKVKTIGFWKVVKFSPIKQNHNYPEASAGELLNGAEISIKWMPSSMGLAFMEDGNYQITNSPYGLDWGDEQSQDEYRVFLKSPSGDVKYQKVSNINEQNNINENNKNSSSKDNVTQNSNSTIDNKEISDFLSMFINYAKNKDINSMLNCYTDEVDYFAKGEVNKNFIKKDKDEYFKRWDDINYQIVDNSLVISDLPNNSKLVEFNFKYSVYSSKRNKKSEGIARSLLKVRQGENGLEIFDEKQKIN